MEGKLSIDRGSNKPSAYYDPSLSGLRSFLLKVSQKGIQRPQFNFYHAGRHLKSKEADNPSMFDIEMGKPKLLRKFYIWLLIGFHL